MNNQINYIKKKYMEFQQNIWDPEINFDTWRIIVVLLKLDPEF